MSFFVSEGAIVGGREDGVYGRHYRHGPHKEDNEIQLLSLTAKGHKELRQPGGSSLILPGCESRLGGHYCLHEHPFGSVLWEK